MQINGFEYYSILIMIHITGITLTILWNKNPNTMQFEEIFSILIVEFPG